MTYYDNSPDLENEELADEQICDTFDDLDADMQLEAFLTKEEVLDFNTFKEKVNQEAIIFSSANTLPQQIKSRDLILKYLEQATKRIGDKSDESKEEKQKTRSLLSGMKREYPGFTGVAVLYAGQIFPDELWYQTINRSLGFGIGKKGTVLSGKYDHTSGCKYTTHLFNLLNWAKKTWQREYFAENDLKSNAKWHPDKSYGSSVEYSEDGRVTEEGYTEDEYLSLQSAMQSAIDRTIDLAHLTKAAFSYSNHTSNAKKSCADLVLDRNVAVTDNLKGLIKSRLEILQLYYTQTLINTTRYPMKGVTIRQNDQTVLTETGNKEFCFFSTTLDKNLEFKLNELIAAKLSEIILENKLYNVKAFGIKILSDEAMAVFLGKSKSNVSERLTYIKELLIPAVEQMNQRYY